MVQCNCITALIEQVRSLCTCSGRHVHMPTAGDLPPLLASKVHSVCCPSIHPKIPPLKTR